MMKEQEVGDVKRSVHDFWNEASCGEKLLLCEESKDGYRNQLEERYRLEPFILPFADFTSANGKKVLEVGVGLGADHQRFAESGADLCGIDLTERAVEHTRQRLALFGLESRLSVGDAETLAFSDDTFDQVYSWGVLHHSPDTPKAVSEVLRVLKPGGGARIMIYHKYSMVGLMLWIRYALLRLRPFTPLAEIYSRYLESPGTKAYSVDEAKVLFSGYSKVAIRTVLTHGDLLESAAGQRHEGLVLNIARRVWPRALIRRFFPNSGLFMLT